MLTDVRDLTISNGGVLAMTGGAVYALAPPVPAPLIDALPAAAEGFTAVSSGQYAVVLSSSTDNLQLWTDFASTPGASHTHTGHAFHDVELVSLMFFAMTDPAFGLVVAPFIMPMMAAASVPLPGALGLTVLQGNVLLVTNAASVFTVDPFAGNPTVWTTHVEMTNPVAVHKTPDNTVLVLNGSPARVLEFTACGVHLRTITLAANNSPRSVVALQVP